MTSYEEYYLKNLYPMQDGIIKIITSLNTPFYLTGGTALSRGYFNHRFSDDLDFFVNGCNNFFDIVNSIIKAIEVNKTDFVILKESTIVSKDFYRVDLKKDDIILKMDFVNDISVRYGDLKKTNNFGLIDSLENILTNKITALYRYEPKDIVDIWIISKKYDFNWEDVLSKSKNKEIGIDPVIVAEIIDLFPKEYLNYIKWIDMPNFDNLTIDLQIITNDILSGNDNSLFNK